jgi:hypothetical protein
MGEAVGRVTDGCDAILLAERDDRDRHCESLFGSADDTD